MKKLTYLFISFAVISFIACGESEENTNRDEDKAEMPEKNEPHVMKGHEHLEGSDVADFIDSREDSRVFFENLNDGDVVSSLVKIKMGVEGMTVHPAGEVIEGTGHHHIIVDNPPVPMVAMVPADENHIHFGGGQTETELELSPGPHTLTLQFADGLHRSYGERLSASVQIEVKTAEAE